MASIIDIPAHIATVINPNIDDPLQESHIHTIPYINIVPGRETSILLPYTPRSTDLITWTHFKYVCTGVNELKIALLFIDGGDEIYISPPTLYQPRCWHTLTFPIVGVVTRDIIIRIYGGDMYTNNNPTEGYRMKFDSLGFTKLFPRKDIYSFMSDNNEIKYVLEKENNGYNNVETFRIHRNMHRVQQLQYIPIYTSHYYLNINNGNIIQ